MDHYFALIIGAIFINNILLAKFLGCCPFLGVSRKMDTAIGMSAAVVFVLTLAGVITWVVQKYLLVPYEIEFIQTLAFILVIATLVQFVELFLKKAVPALYKSLGIFLPLITTNCAVLGTAIINVQEGFNLLDTVVFSAASAAGFGLALVLFAGIRERFEITRIPKPLEGTGIGLVTAGLLALSFYAFKGMI
ncbi:MAG: electron transport complex subunit RsxA [Planctomycetota bacterium]|jgi:electron transport complex protein RnfA